MAVSKSSSGLLFLGGPDLWFSHVSTGPFIGGLRSQIY